MSTSSEKVLMTPDGTVQWNVREYTWGRLLFPDETDPAVLDALVTLCTKGPSQLPDVQLMTKASDGVLWRVGEQVVKHYTADDAADPLNTTKANVTLGVGLERIDARVGGRPLRTPRYLALALMHHDEQSGRRAREHDGLVMIHVPGRHLTAAEFTAGADERIALYRAAIEAAGGESQHYLLDDKPDNLLDDSGDKPSGVPSGTLYKLDIDMI